MLVLFIPHIRAQGCTRPDVEQEILKRLTKLWANEEDDLRMIALGNLALGAYKQHCAALEAALHQGEDTFYKVLHKLMRLQYMDIENPLDERGAHAWTEAERYNTWSGYFFHTAGLETVGQHPLALAAAIRENPALRTKMKNQLVRLIQSPQFDHLCTALSTASLSCPIWIGKFANSFGIRALNKLSVPLQGVILAKQIYDQVMRALRGEIAPESAVINVGKALAATAAGVVGCQGGAMVGGTFGGAVGAFVGCSLGAMGAASFASSVIGRFLSWLFDIPDDEKLAHAMLYFGVGKHATNAEINKAYRRLARKHHPDKGGSDEEMVKLGVYLEIIRNHRISIEKEARDKEEL